MDLKVLRKLNMRRRISCSRAASKYCWGVKYGMVFFGGRRYGGWWVGVKPKTVGFVFWGVGIEDIDAIEAIDAIDAIDAIEDGLWGLWAWWDGEEQKVGFAEKKAASRKKSRLRRRKTAPVGVGVGGCVGGGFEGRAQNIAPLHLMRCLIAGYNLEGALEGRAQNIAPLQDYKTILPIKP